MAGWNADNAAGPIGQGAVTLVEGSSFCISLQNGDIFPHHPHGVFHLDTRILSRWCLTINGQPMEALGAWTPSPYQGSYIGRAIRSDGRADSPLSVERRRKLGAGLLEDIIIHNYALGPAACEVALSVDADFADLFEVKDGRFHRQWTQTRRFEDGAVRLEAVWQDVRKGVVVTAPDGKASADGLHFQTVIPAQGEWNVRVAVVPVLEGVEPSLPSMDDGPEAISPQDRRRQSWVASIPPVRIGNPSLQRIHERSYADIGALRITDPQNPDRMVVAAGAPWFMALFGRDSLLASFMVMPINAPLALGTLQTLADLQGTAVDPMTEEQPGRILHEVRFGVATGVTLGGKSAYYGTADATPLFVTLLGEVSRWGVAPEDIAALMPNADRALDWIRDYGDSDGDGFVEYERLNEHGLINQGWKDSWDGINFADGQIAEPPIALCEVQGYVYSAYVARAWMAHDAGNRGLAAELLDRAEQLKKQFNERFWLPDHGYYAVALDRDKRPVDACASNMGHCLWSGIVDEDKARQVADRLMSPEMFSGWGVRTLATDMGAYNPVSYHNGSVWPHDNALIVAGLMRYGFVPEAQRIATALMEAAEYTNHRLPELFCGFSRSVCPEPLPYPTACSPQAWAATTPVMLMRSLLRHDAHYSLGGLWIDPVLPETWGDFHAENVAMGEARFTFDVSGSQVTVEGLPEGIKVHRGMRPSLADTAELDRLRRTK
ncbi:glycogen debranching enzyme [Arthrobacter globiformis]|uniref:amylo-alpha-1,6-glucosidase n=1 Tax=Arthrobacter globiformis TaxID=1665 RepID=UPI0027886A25|nr:glycogen debranching N-terminal domain-containing protein [Arthrobacter globiformis]MDQ1060835.1 glycogen debranching enzyme [Arthrobacter globiformis]